MTSIQPAPSVQPGRESVWDYPRPPRLEPSARLVRVVLGDVQLARSRRSLRILETSHPPVYYVPEDDVRMDLLQPASRTTFCEWKGVASYYSARAGELVVPDVAWTYRRPSPGYEALAGHLAFYPEKVEAYLEGERVRAQGGGFYGGWITDEVVGPFKR